MDIVTVYALAPLAVLALGGLAGVLTGRYLGTRHVLILIAAISAVGVYLMVQLAMVGEGEEEAAILPFATLTGGVLPALLGAIMGGVGGLAMTRRNRAE